MDAAEIKQHWQNWARAFETDLRATTKTPTIKRLEVNALSRALSRVGVADGPSEVLEVGCGNGHNCLALAELLPDAVLTGVDYVEDMVAHANALRAVSPWAERLRFEVGDATELVDHPGLDRSYDAAFTVRCLVNLSSPEAQRDALAQLAAVVRPRGHVVLLENVVDGFELQNAWRVAAGLPPREPAAFNLFLNHELVTGDWTSGRLDLIAAESFGSLHDLVLYVLAPMVSSGAVDYDAPIVNAATELTLALAGDGELDGFPAVGQNRLYLFRKPG